MPPVEEGGLSTCGEGGGKGERAWRKKKGLKGTVLPQHEREQGLD